jgi:signal peptidase
MKDILKKIGLFLLVIIVLTLFSNILFRYLSPLKPVILVSGSMEPAYKIGEVLFYGSVTEYSLNDVVLADANRPQLIISRIVLKNDDGTYTLKGDHNAASLAFEKDISKDQLKGKIIFSLNPLFFYGIDYGLKVVIALILVLFVFKRK